MIKFLKSLLNFAITVVAGPAIALYNYKELSKVGVVVNTVALAARVAFVAAYFVVLPVAVVFAAKCWLIAELVLGVVALIATLGFVAAAVATGEDFFDGLAAKVSEELDAEAAAA